MLTEPHAACQLPHSVAVQPIEPEAMTFSLLMLYSPAKKLPQRIPSGLLALLRVRLS